MTTMYLKSWRLVTISKGKDLCFFGFVKCFFIKSLRLGYETKGCILMGPNHSPVICYACGINKNN